MSHMTDDLIAVLRKKFDNPVSHFVDYTITADMSEDQRKKWESMSQQEREAWEQIPEDLRIQIKPEFAGLVNGLSIASDLAYEIANNVPNTPDKQMCIGLLEHLCKYLSTACKPEAINGKQ